MPAPGFRRVIFLMGVHLRQCVECVQQSCIYGRHLHFSVSSLVYEPMALRIHKANPTPFTLLVPFWSRRCWTAQRIHP
ncbi:hypothetical protein V8C40DRAFT_248775 [Trichoderma camerunense]